jgi:hypothetical protein
METALLPLLINAARPLGFVTHLKRAVERAVSLQHLPVVLMEKVASVERTVALTEVSQVATLSTSQTDFVQL